MPPPTRGEAENKREQNPCVWFEALGSHLARLPILPKNFPKQNEEDQTLAIEEVVMRSLKNALTEMSELRQWHDGMRTAKNDDERLRLSNNLPSLGPTFRANNPNPDTWSDTDRSFFARHALRPADFKLQRIRLFRQVFQAALPNLISPANLAKIEGWDKTLAEAAHSCGVDLHDIFKEDFRANQDQWDNAPETLLLRHESPERANLIRLRRQNSIKPGDIIDLKELGYDIAGETKLTTKLYVWHSFLDEKFGIT
ncbi:hypothetical protein HY933_01185 [Candidatus Falkowbacteria bacterium]|nr:hypothetical protein [Candidatus Falkowbacteria bacterium]